MKSFKIFERIEKKEKKRLDDKVTEMSDGKMVRFTREFSYVPPEAFKEINQYDEYEYLQDGLMLGNRLLDFREDIRDICEKYDVDAYQRQGRLGQITWFDAKRLTEKLDAIMMTPAMHFCIMDHLNETEKYPLYNNLAFSNSEWLDAIIDVHDSKIVTHPKLIPTNEKKDPMRSWKDGIQYEMQTIMVTEYSGDLGFYDENLLSYIGFPTMADENQCKGNHILRMPREDVSTDVAVRSGRHLVGNDNRSMIACDKPIHITDPECGIRLCYRVNK